MQPLKHTVELSVRLSIHMFLCVDVAFLIYSHADVNRKDYRAWYGLGQAYELLNMHQYALHYYQHATALRYASPICAVFCQLMMASLL
jgi:hypothetical protein